MSITIDNIAEKILSKNIDKQEAIRNFESLSESEKNLLISRLKLKLSDGDNIPDEKFAEKEKFVPLKSVSERNIGEKHQEFIKQLAQDLEKFAPKSKDNALKHQKYFVDQRNNLKKSLKALQFHLTYEKAEGVYLYDIDGNQYIDITGDNGVNIFGHQPEFIKKSIESRVNKGFPLVGYTEELFEAAKLFTDITGHERVLFTQSGTEAVMWAVRIARAATQKNKIVIFEGSYHDMSMGLEMLQAFADELIILDYGRMDHLDIIENRAHEIAGILVEPVQSRQLSNQPIAFLKELRKLTLEKQIPLILDEMITGFRVCPKGAEGYFGIKADIATYGNISGGSMPTGMVAGLAKYMNYVDGGTSQFGGESMPSLQRTLMAETHTRNSVKIAASFATLTEINERCSGKLECSSCTCFQKELNANTKSMAEEINEFFLVERTPIVIEYFGSLFRLKFLDDPHGLTSKLFFIVLRMNCVETSVSGNFFLTTAHTNENIKSVIEAVKKTTKILLRGNFFYEAELNEVAPQEYSHSEPVNTIQADRIKVSSTASNSKIEQLKNLIKSDLLRFKEEAL